MPPHCDTLDGPVVSAARRALLTSDVNLVLPYVPKTAESEVADMFERVISIQKNCAGFEEGVSLVENWFFENVVRLHRTGEGAAYTGLKPAGLDTGPIIPVAEKAIETGSPDELAERLADLVKQETKKRFERMVHLKEHADHGVDHAREYVESMLGIQVWSHKLYKAATSDAHEGAHDHGEVHNH